MKDCLKAVAFHNFEKLVYLVCIQAHNFGFAISRWIDQSDNVSRNKIPFPSVDRSGKLLERQRGQESGGLTVIRVSDFIGKPNKIGLASKVRVISFRMNFLPETGRPMLLGRTDLVRFY